MAGHRGACRQPRAPAPGRARARDCRSKRPRIYPRDAIRSAGVPPPGRKAARARAEPNWDHRHAAGSDAMAQDQTGHFMPERDAAGTIRHAKLRGPRSSPSANTPSAGWRAPWPPRVDVLRPMDQAGPAQATIGQRKTPAWADRSSRPRHRPAQRKQRLPPGAEQEEQVIGQLPADAVRPRRDRAGDNPDSIPDFLNRDLRAARMAGNHADGQPRAPAPRPDRRAFAPWPVRPASRNG